MSGNNPKKVERITPSAQSEIDKKSYRDLDQDFVTSELSSRLVTAERTERTPEKKRRIGDKVRYFEVMVFGSVRSSRNFNLCLSVCHFCPTFFQALDFLYSHSHVCIMNVQASLHAVSQLSLSTFTYSDRQSQ